MNQLRRLRGHNNKEDSSGFEDNMAPVRSRRCSLQRCESKTNLMDTAAKNHDKIMKYASLSRPPIGKSIKNKKIARLTENNGSNSRGNEDDMHRDARKSRDFDETMSRYKFDVDENNPPRTSLQRTASNVTNSSMNVEAGDMRPSVSATNTTKRQNKNLQKMFQKAARKTNNAPMDVPVVKENRFVQNQENSLNKTSSNCDHRPPSAMSKSSTTSSAISSESEWMKERVQLLTQLKQSRELVRQCLEKMRTAEDKASQVPHLEMQIVTLKRQLCQEISKNQLSSAVSAASSLNSIADWDDNSSNESRYPPVGISHNNSPIHSDDEVHKDRKRAIEMTSLDRAHAALQRLQNRCGDDNTKHRSPIDGASDEEENDTNTLISVKAHKKALQSVKELSERNATQQAEIDQLKRVLYNLMPHSKNK